jgi:hypothetical protein
MKSGDKPAAAQFVFSNSPKLTLHAIDFIEESSKEQRNSCNMRARYWVGRERKVATACPSK